MVKEVLERWEEHPAFGYRKMALFLQNHTVEGATEKRVRLIYKRLGLKGLTPVFKTTRADKGSYKYPYLLRNKEIRFVNQVWATDITYIKLPKGRVYLTAIIDLYSRKILSWTLSERMDTSFCLEALHEAIYRYGVPAIFNTDCESQYTSKEFVAALQSYNIEISMDGIGRCLDNVRVERTWRTIKYEFVFLHNWESKKQLESGLEYFINDFNSERPHQALGYQRPDEVYYNGCFPVREENRRKTG